MDIGLLVQGIATVLAPCLPFLLNLDQKAGEEAMGKASAFSRG